MAPKSGTLVIPLDFGTRWNHSDIAELAKVLEVRLEQPVVVCFPDDPVEIFTENIRSFVRRGIRRQIILPLGARGITESEAVAEKLIAAGQAVADVHFHAADPLGWSEWSNWLRQFASEKIGENGGKLTTTGIVLITRGGQSPIEDADLARMAHLMSRDVVAQNVSYAFLDGQRPDLADAMRRVVQEGAEKILVIPWLADEQTLLDIEKQIHAKGLLRGGEVSIANPTLNHPSLIDHLISRHRAGSSDHRLQMYLELLARYKTANAASPFPREDGSELTAEETTQLAELDRKLNAMLPPEYQGQYESVQPTSMGTAGLKYDSDGKIAWDEIWTSFCDLALAGGPPHRGTLLEAVTSAEALAEPEKYQEVVKEIERGIRMVTGLPLITSRNQGWVGVICESEEMAVWLMRAIIVENVMVRREGDILYLPAGPNFTVKREIKNVITAIAKTVHYWKAHLFANRQPREGN